MRILLVTANFATEGVNPWLLDDLARQLGADGHDVDVIVHSPTAPRPRGPQPSPADGVTVFSVGAERAPRGPLGKLVSYLATGARLRTAGWRALSPEAYDLCLYPSIGVFSYGFPGRVRRARRASLLTFVLWDFFPVHQIEIGRIRPRSLAPALKALERRAVEGADVIAVMSPANAAFLAAYHPGLAADVLIVPPWAADTADGTSTVKRERFTVVFGGQLVKGRGVETLLEASRILRSRSAEVDIVIAGSGVERTNLEQLANELELESVSFVGNLEREAYRRLLRECHLGVAITVEGVSPPSFPSKIVEYCANSIPVVVAVESSSDAGSIVEEHGAGFSIPAGDSAALADALERAQLEHRQGLLPARADRARRFFEDELSVAAAAARLASSALTRAL